MPILDLTVLIIFCKPFRSSIFNYLSDSSPVSSFFLKYTSPSSPSFLTYTVPSSSMSILVSSSSSPSPSSSSSSPSSSSPSSSSSSISPSSSSPSSSSPSSSSPSSSSWLLSWIIMSLYWDPSWDCEEIWLLCLSKISFGDFILFFFFSSIDFCFFTFDFFCRLVFFWFSFASYALASISALFCNIIYFIFLNRSSFDIRLFQGSSSLKNSFTVHGSSTSCIEELIEVLILYIIY